MNLKIPQATKTGYIEVEEGGVFDISYPSSKTRRGRVVEGGKICPTIPSSLMAIVLYEKQIDMEQERKFRIRKLTPKECFRLMDVDEKNIDKMLNAGISNSRLYCLAGNSIVVSCLELIFQNIFYPDAEEVEEPTLF